MYFIIILESAHVFGQIRQIHIGKDYNLFKITHFVLDIDHQHLNLNK